MTSWTERHVGDGDGACRSGSPLSAFVFTLNDLDYYRIVSPTDGHLRITLELPGTGHGRLRPW